MRRSAFWQWLDEDVLRCRVRWVCDINDRYCLGAGDPNG